MCKFRGGMPVPRTAEFLVYTFVVIVAVGWRTDASEMYMNMQMYVRSSCTNFCSVWYSFHGSGSHGRQTKERLTLHSPMLLQSSFIMGLPPLLLITMLEFSSNFIFTKWNWNLTELCYIPTTTPRCCKMCQYTLAVWKDCFGLADL